MVVISIPSIKHFQKQNGKNSIQRYCKLDTNYSFNKTFSKTKMLEALTYCKLQINYSLKEI